MAEVWDSINPMGYFFGDSETEQARELPQTMPQPEPMVNEGHGPGVIAGAATKLISDVVDAERMIALRRSLVIGIVLLAIGALLRAFKKNVQAGIFASIGAVTLVTAIAQYVI